MTILASGTTEFEASRTSPRNAPPETWANSASGASDPKRRHGLTHVFRHLKDANEWRSSAAGLACITNRNSRPAHWRWKTITVSISVEISRYADIIYSFSRYSGRGRLKK